MSAADFVVTAEWDRVTYAEVAANLSAYVDGDDGARPHARPPSTSSAAMPLLGTARAAHHGGELKALMAADGWALGLTPADAGPGALPRAGGEAAAELAKRCGPMRCSTGRSPPRSTT